MSLQETKLKAIADAIREKDGTTAPIPANDFPDRIRAISSMPEGVHEISVTSSDDSMGAVAGGGMASEGMLVTVSATPLNGNEFKAWQEDGAVVSEDAQYTFDVMRSRVLEAIFAEFRLSWNAVTLLASGNWTAIAYGDGKFVAIMSYAQKAAYSTDGINWAEATTPPRLSYTAATCIAYGNGKFIAPIMDSNNYVFSNDGINWSHSMSMPLKYPWSGIAYGNGKFVVVAGNGSKYEFSLYSTDGNNWEKANIPSGDYRSVTYGNGKFVAITWGASKAAYSVDGINWVETKLPVMRKWTAVAYGNERYVAISYSQQEAAYSTDGINWVKTSLPIVADWTNLAYGDGKFVAVAGNSIQSAYSTDGVNWTKATLPSSAQWGGIAYGDGKFVTLENGGNKAAYALA